MTLVNHEKLQNTPCKIVVQIYLTPGFFIKTTPIASNTFG